MSAETGGGAFGRWMDIQRWPRWAWVFVLTQSGAALILQLRIAWGDLSVYTGQVGPAFAIIYWLIAALVTFLSIISIVRGATWTLEPLIVSQFMILLSCLYVAWVDGGTASRDGWLYWLAVPMGIIAMLVIPPTLLGLRGLPSRVWKVGLALLPGLGFLQFWLQEEVWPSFEIPVLAVEAELAQVASVGDTAYVEAQVRLANESRVRLAVPAAFAYLVAIPHAGVAEPAEPDVTEVGFWATTRNAGDHGYRIDRNTGATVGPGLVLLENMVGLNWVMEPGEKYTRTFAFAIDAASVARIDLAVEGIAVKELALAEPETCADGGSSRVSSTDSDFWNADLVVAGEYGPYWCLSSPVRPTGALRKALHEPTLVQVQYGLSALNDPSDRRLRWQHLVDDDSGEAAPQSSVPRMASTGRFAEMSVLIGTAEGER